MQSNDRGGMGPQGGGRYPTPPGGMLRKASELE